MKHFRRTIFTALTTVLILCCVGVAILWKRDYWKNGSVPSLTINDLCFSLDASTAVNVTIPNSISQLDGKTVSIIGDIYSPRSADKIVQFDLTDKSHFHSYMPRPPPVQEFVHVKLKPGLTVNVDDVDQKIRVTGTLHVKVEKDEQGIISSIYRLDADSVERAAGNG